MEWKESSKEYFTDTCFGTIVINKDTNIVIVYSFVSTPKKWYPIKSNSNDYVINELKDRIHRAHLLHLKTLSKWFK